MHSFKFRDWELPYCTGDYNSARLNERAVEVPIAQYLMLSHGPHNTLEIGAVLPHYAAHTHTVVDRDERWPNVINADVLDWEPPDAFPFIVSISTLEHTGSMEAFSEAVRLLDSWVKPPKGELMITLPYGWQGAPWLDVVALVKDNPFEFTEIIRYDKVDTLRHLWSPIDLDAPWKPYNGASTWANSVVVMLKQKGPKRPVIIKRTTENDTNE